MKFKSAGVILYFNLLVEIFRKCRQKLFRFASCSNSEYRTRNPNSLLSDSQRTPYEETVVLLTQSPSRFKTFRRNPNYREILEHVGVRLGDLYLEKIKYYDEDLRVSLPILKSLGNVGKPFRYFFKEVGLASPTALRYLSTGLEITHCFHEKDTRRIAEIGMGFGGLGQVLNKLIKVDNIDFFDLPSVMNLSERYLEESESDLNFTFQEIDNYGVSNLDLCISNYAFSELPKSLQLTYLSKVCQKSSCGYLIMNSGLGDSTYRNSGKLSILEILDFLPTAQVYEEIPNSGPDNYLILWGHTLEPYRALRLR